MNSKESAVLRKVVYQIAEINPESDTDVFEAASTAIDRVTTLERRINELDGRLEEIESATGINLEGCNYSKLSRPGKVKKLRDALKDRAAKNGGKYAMDYNEVMALFDYGASAGHAIEISKAVAEYDEETDTAARPGFDYQKRSDGNNRVTVNLDEVEKE